MTFYTGNNWGIGIRWTAGGGVPQGSILGPLLYINILSIITSSSICRCKKKILSFQDSFLLQSDLDQLSTWCQDNGLSFNISKSCLLGFHNRTANAISTDYTVNNVNLSSLYHYRDLGIIISTDMSWSRHYNAVTAKA